MEINKNSLMKSWNTNIIPGRLKSIRKSGRKLTGGIMCNIINRVLRSFERLEKPSEDDIYGDQKTTKYEVLEKT